MLLVVCMTTTVSHLCPFTSRCNSILLFLTDTVLLVPYYSCSTEIRVKMNCYMHCLFIWCSPVQCISPDSNNTISPALISFTICLPDLLTPTLPLPERTIKTCPLGWLCQCDLDSGSEVTSSILRGMDFRSFIQTFPVKRVRSCSSPSPLGGVFP